MSYFVGGASVHSARCSNALKVVILSYVSPYAILS